MTISSDITTPAFGELTSWENLLLAYHNASRGKRGKLAAASFEYKLTDNLLTLQEDLQSGRYQHGPYHSFTIHEPKRRIISAAAFRDRVAHHALCNVIQPRFERLFIKNSFANRVGKGTHAAVNRFQAYASQYKYVLRADIQQFFPAIDHIHLLHILKKQVPEQDVCSLIVQILESGADASDNTSSYQWFVNDDLFSMARTRGLPIGNLTSQLWANCYLHTLDQFVTRELQCKAYVRYVDDFALFSDNKKTLLDWKQTIITRLAKLRLRIHESSAQPEPVTNGLPWLGFVIYPDYRHLKGRKVRNTRRHLHKQLEAYHAGDLCFAALTASVQGWLNHARYANTWHLREAILSDLIIKPALVPKTPTGVRKTKPE